MLQFRIEEPDEQKTGRKIDLIASPCGPTIWIDGRRCTQFDTLLPIECKRLPTPKDKNRDEREYVINRKATTGGIQRFKAGDHGAAHSRAAIIAYVQAETPQIWFDRLNPDGHPKLLHLWPVKLLQAGRSDGNYTGATAMREAASFSR